MFVDAPEPFLSDAVQGQIRRVFKPAVLKSSLVRDAARRIAQWELTAPTFTEGIYQYVQLMRDFQHYILESGAGWNFNVCSAIGSAIARLQAARLPLSSGNLAQLKKLSEAHDRQTFDGGMLADLRDTYVTRFHAVATLREVFGNADLAYFGDFSSPEEMSQAIGDVVAGINCHRAYGVKPSTMRDGLLHPPTYDLGIQ